MADDVNPAQAQALADLKLKCLEWLADIAGGYEVDKVADAFFRLGSTRINLFFRPFGDEQTIVSVFVYLLWKVPKTPELMEYVAFNSANHYFGSIQLSPDGDDDEKVTVLFDHSLLGDYIDYEEFKEAALGVGAVADRLDTELQQRFGGETHYEDWS